MKLILVFKHFTFLLMFYLKPSKEDLALGRTSGWSECSKSCNGGVQWRSVSNSTTREWRVCVSSPCPLLSKHQSWADDLCAGSHQGSHTGHRQYGKWLSFVRSDAPCSLLCRDSTKPEIFKRLDSTIMDGRRCETEGGTLKNVGCDLVVGSGARLDQCGQCGGDGSSCSSGGVQRFVWGMRETGECSVSCGGGGTQPVTFMCEDSLTASLVPPGLCHNQKKPLDTHRHCGSADCHQSNSNRASYRNNYNEDRQTEEYYDYEEEKEVGEDGYSYDNLTHLADYLETASSSERNLNPVLSLAALLLFVFLSESSAMF